MRLVRPCILGIATPASAKTTVRSFAPFLVVLRGDLDLEAVRPAPVATTDRRRAAVGQVELGEVTGVDGDDELRAARERNRRMGSRLLCRDHFLDEDLDLLSDGRRPNSSRRQGGASALRCCLPE